MTSRTVKTAAFLSTALVCASALAMHLMPAGSATSPQFVQKLAHGQAVRVTPDLGGYPDWRHAAARPEPMPVVVVTGQRMSEAEKAAFDALQAG